MPKKAAELSAIDVKRLKHPGQGRNVMFAVGGVAGLFLQIIPTGARSWIFRTTIGAKRRDIGLGGYPDVSLAQAREMAREAKNKIRQGIDPIEERKAVRAALVASQKRSLTFAEATDRFLESRLTEFKNDQHKQQLCRTGDWRAAGRGPDHPRHASRAAAALADED
ncbi:Arm DNA-binding domain-containing protein [Paracoccus rhizosphaerae]|uniref:Arm DNA-binding domain-containing protein n=1 Tax=Paracoccus rhizosphaerae TaxID=1133347 RepID=A0ABV6CL59_9RHOB|nr:Arm DNA-binding domain-containing protein [Paracoccus rhizosphaerae]